MGLLPEPRHGQGRPHGGAEKVAKGARDGDRGTLYEVERAVEGLGKVGLAGDLALVEGVAKTRRRDLRGVARRAADFIRNRALGE